MSLEQRERIGLWLALTALVLTGGASSAWRLALVAIPLMVFQLPFGITIIVALLSLLPSAVELWIYGNWIGPLGGRLSLVASTLVACSAVALGRRLLQSRELRRDLTVALPIFTFGLMTQSFIRLFDLVPATWQYLSGNNLSAFLLFGSVLVLGLRMGSLARSLSMSFLVIALIVTGSRWGIWVALVFGLLMVATVWEGRSRWVAGCALITTAIMPWLFLTSIDASKGGLVRALMGISSLRPWSGLGPGGAEQVSLQFVEQTSRLTHIESLIWDWSATLGWPMTCCIGLVCLVLAWGPKQSSELVTVERLQKLAAIGLLGILCHDLFDFSLFSGAVRVGFGCLVGMLLPWQVNQPRGRFAGALSVVITVSALAGWHHYDPMRMELSTRLTEIPDRYGERPFRFWLARGRGVDAPQMAQRYFSQAVSIAPGSRESWFALGDSLRRLDLVDQGLLAYRRGLEVSRPTWSGTATEGIAQLPLSVLPGVIGDHLGAARAVARLRSSGSQREHRYVGALDRQHRDPVVREWYQKALFSGDFRKSYVVRSLWNLAQEKPLFPGDGVRYLRHLIEREPRVNAGDLLLRLVRINPEHCLGLGDWPDTELMELVHVEPHLENACREHLLGKGRSLRVLSILREMRSP